MPKFHISFFFNSSDQWLSDGLTCISAHSGFFLYPIMYINQFYYKLSASFF